MCYYVIYQTLSYEHLNLNPCSLVLVVCVIFSLQFSKKKKHKGNRNEDFFRKLLKQWHFSTQNSNKMGVQCCLFLMIICAVICYKKPRYLAHLFHAPYIAFSDTLKKITQGQENQVNFPHIPLSITNKCIFIFEKLFDYPY